MKTNPLNYLKSREKLRIKKLQAMVGNLSYLDYIKSQSIFSDDYLFFSSYEAFMNKSLQSQTGTVFVPEWLIFFMIDKSVQRWIINNDSLESISILVPNCGSGAFIQIIIEYLFVQFKKIYPHYEDLEILKNIIRNNIQGWDVNKQALDICTKRITTLFNFEPNIKHSTTILEKNYFDLIIGVAPRGNIFSSEFKQFINSPHSCASLEFIDWSLKSIHDSGEISFIVPYELSSDISFEYWRKMQLNNLNIHSIIELDKNMTQNKKSFILGMNKQQNHIIEKTSFINLQLKEMISVYNFYNTDCNYTMSI